MKRHPPPGTTDRARRLRSEPTEAEKRLWRLLRENFGEARFRRQVPIRQYVCDFASHKLRLVIEADGGQHGTEADANRDTVIEADGYRIVRFWNNDILQNPQGIAEKLTVIIAEVSPHP